MTTTALNPDMHPTSISGALDRQTPSCPLCAGTHATTRYRDIHRDSHFQPNPATVVQCDACGFLFSSPQPDPQVLAAYYRDSTLVSGQTYRDESGCSHFHRQNTARATFLSRFLRHRPEGRLLDVGCGSGGFLQALRDTGLPGWIGTGLDQSERALQGARHRGFQVYLGLIGDALFPTAAFDAISALSVLEHLADPLAALAWCRRLLKPDGLLFVEVPDSLHPEISLTGFFSGEHIVHFTPGSLTRALQLAGFDAALADPDAAGVVRLVASSDCRSWGSEPDPLPENDAEQARQAISAYAADEQRQIGMLQRRVRERLERWRRQGRRIAVYGAGVHSLQLARLVDLQTQILCYLDGDHTKQGQEFLGFP